MRMFGRTVQRSAVARVRSDRSGCGGCCYVGACARAIAGLNDSDSGRLRYRPKYLRVNMPEYIEKSLTQEVRCMNLRYRLHSEDARRTREQRILVRLQQT